MVCNSNSYFYVFNMIFNEQDFQYEIFNLCIDVYFLSICCFKSGSYINLMSIIWELVKITIFSLILFIELEGVVELFLGNLYFREG